MSPLNKNYLNISEFKNGEYIAHIDSALIDTDAYIFLKADYNSDAYLKEKDRNG